MTVSQDVPAGPDPVAAFAALGTGEGAVLLERPGARAVVGLDPVTVATAHGGAVTWTDGPVAGMREGAPLTEVLCAGSPPAVAVLGGNALRARPAPEPDAAVVFPSVLVAFEGDRVRLSAPTRSRLDDLADRLAAVPPLPSVEAAPPVPEPTFDSEVPDDAYQDLIKAAHARIIAGEVRQVTISRRFAVRAAVDPVAVYRRLRAGNPSPYHFLLRLPGRTLVGASPQGLLTVDGRRVSVPVIAGTRRRGADPAEDAALAAELLADPKERDEHAMIVELARADLAAVADPATIRVADGAPEVHRYARVMHLVSEVTAGLVDGRTALDALAAVLPSGTVAGTPRQAAQRVIDEIEPRSRGLYGGGVGWLGPDGDLDFCLGIRTLLFEGGTAYCQAGAGVVAGSVPHREVQESRDKASALFAALESCRPTPPGNPDDALMP